MLSARIITIDPGLYSTGWALWDTNWKLLQAGLWRGRAEKWEEKAKEVLWKFIVMYKEIAWVKEVYCEYPKIFNTPEGLQIGLSGNIEKLTFLVGCYAGFSFSQGIQFNLVEVNQWKGQLPKSVVKQRIKKILGKDATKNFIEDMWDAVGIGLYKAGRL